MADEHGWKGSMSGLLEAVARDPMQPIELRMAAANSLLTKGIGNEEPSVLAQMSAQELGELLAGLRIAMESQARELAAIAGDPESPLLEKLTNDELDRLIAGAAAVREERRQRARLMAPLALPVPETQQIMAATPLRLIAPTPSNRTVANQPPRRRKNAELREREYLTEPEVERLFEAAGKAIAGAPATRR
jgi:hypothetical protein